MTTEIVHKMNSIAPAPLLIPGGNMTSFDSFLFPFHDDELPFVGSAWPVAEAALRSSPVSGELPSTNHNSDEDKSEHVDIKEEGVPSGTRKRTPPKVASSNSGENDDVTELKKIKNRESAKRSRDKKKKMESEKDVIIRELQEKNDALAHENNSLQSKVRCLETENASLGEEIRHLLNIVYGVGRRVGQVFNSIPHICPSISSGTGAASAVIFLLFIAFYIYNPMLAFLTSAQNGVRGPFGVQRGGQFSLAPPPAREPPAPVIGRSLLSERPAETSNANTALVVRNTDVAKDTSTASIDYVVDATTTAVYQFDANAKRFKPVPSFPHPMPIETHVFGVHGRGSNDDKSNNAIGRLVQINLSGDGDLKESLLAYVVGMNYDRKGPVVLPQVIADVNDTKMQVDDQVPRYFEHRS